MQEFEMSLDEIRNNFGDDIADQCALMKNKETKEFHTATYEGIVVRCERGFWTTYYVRGELLEEEALELDYGLELGM